MINLKNYFIDLLYSREINREYAIKLETLKEGEKISIISDTMFKTMFQNENRLKYSCKLLSYYLDLSYEELLENVHLAKNEIDKKFEKDKGERCDYVAEINGSYVNIEVNTNSSIKTLERNMEYAHRLYARLNKRNKNKKEHLYTQVIQFNINNFSFKGLDKIVDIYINQNDEKISMSNKIIFVQIYIPNLRRKWYNESVDKLTESEKYILGLVEPSIESSQLLGEENLIMKEYIEDATNASLEEEIGEAYDKELAFKEEMKTIGFEEGIKQGSKREKEQIALSMLKENLEPKIISKFTGLTIKEIKNLE